jgi:hypothetical protein
LSRIETDRLYLCAAAALVGLTALGLALPHAPAGQFGIGYGAALDVFVAVALAQGAVYALCVGNLSRGAPTLRVILGVAALLRAMVLVWPPFLSNDLYRYIWDGWVQLAGINPFAFIPDDPHLAFLRDAAVFPNINRAAYAHTIYPPAAQMLFAASAGVSRVLHLPPVLGLKLFEAGFEAGTIWALLRLLRAAGQPASRVLIYAWNPVPVWEFASSGHVDVFAVTFVALALLAAVTARPGWAAAALAAATLVKLLPVILVPALWRRWDWRFAGLFAGMIVLLYAPYLAAGRHVLGFLPGYTAQEGIDSGRGLLALDALAALVALPPWSARLYLALLAVALAALGLAVALRARPQTAPARAMAMLLLAGALMAGMSPHYPWYYPFLLVPACLARCPAALWLVTASPALYLDPAHTGLLWPSAVFAPALLLALWQLVRPAPSSRLGGLAA